MRTGHDARICHGRDHAFGEAERRPSTDSDLGFGLCLMMMVMCGRLCRVNRQNGYLICSLSCQALPVSPPYPGSAVRLALPVRMRRESLSIVSGERSSFCQP